MAKLGGAKPFATEATGGGGGAGSDTTAIHDNVAAEISAITAKAAPIDADHLVIEDSAASNAKKRITVGQVRGAVSASDYAALSQSVIENGTGQLTWTALVQNNAVSTNVTESGEVDNTGEVMVTVNPRIGATRAGNYVQADIGSGQDYSAYQCIRIRAAFSEVSLKNPRWVFRTSTGATITANVVDELPVPEYQTGEWTEFTFFLSDASNVRSFGFFLTENKINQSASANGTVYISQVELPAMPKWWNAVVSNSGQDILIPANYSDAQADPDYAIIPSGTTLIDQRNGHASDSILFTHKDRTQNQWIVGPTSTGDKTNALIHLFASVADGDVVDFPHKARYRFDSITGTIKIKYATDFTINRNWSVFYASATSRDVPIEAPDEDANHGIITNAHNIGRGEVTAADGGTGNPGDDFTIDKNVAVTANAGGTIVMAGVGDLIHGVLGDHVRVLQSDGRLQMEYQWTWTSASGDANDVEIYWSTEPITGAMVAAFGALTHDGSMNADAGYQWTASGSGTNEYYLELSGGGNPNINDNGTEPVNVYESAGVMAAGTAGSLAVGEWDWADNDTLGFNTVYVRLTDEADPDTDTMQYQGIEFSDQSITDTFVNQINNDLWFRNTTTGAEGRIDAHTNKEFTVTTADDGAFNGGTRQNFDVNDVVEIFEKLAGVEIYNASGVLQTDAQGRPTRTVTPPTSSETWTIRAPFPRRIDWYTGVYFRKLSTTNTVTISAYKHVNKVEYVELEGQASAFSFKNCNNLLLRNYIGEASGGDAIACTGARNYDNTVENWLSLGNRRQGASTTESVNFTLRNGKVISPARSAIDVEPSSGPCEGFTIDGLEVGAISSGQKRLGGILAMTANGKTTHPRITNLVVRAPSPLHSGGNISDAGAEPSGDFRLQSGIYEDWDADVTSTLVFDGQEQTFRNMRLRRIQLQSGASDNNLQDIYILPPDDGDASGTEFLFTIEDNGTDNFWDGVKWIGNDDEITPFANANQDGQFRPLDIGTATDIQLARIHFGWLQQMYPEHFRGDVVHTKPWFPGGLDLNQEGIRNIRHLSGSSTRVDGKNFTNTHGAAAGESKPVTPRMNIIFPLRPDERPTSPTDFNINASGTQSGGSLGNGTTYYYAIGAGTNYAGVHMPSYVLDAGGNAVDAQTPSGANLTVYIRAKNGLGDSDLRTKQRIVRGTTDGSYDTSWLIEPTLSIKGDFPQLDGNADYLDDGTGTLTHPFGDGNNGYAATYAQVTGNITTGTVSANNGDTDSLALADTRLTDSTKNFCGDGTSPLNVYPGAQVTVTSGTGSGTAYVKEVYPTHLELTSGITSFTSGDGYAIKHWWGKGGYRLSGGVPTWGDNQFHDEFMNEPDSKYHVELSLWKDVGATFNGVVPDVWANEWGISVVWRTSDGTTLASAATGNVYCDVRIFR